MAKIDIDSFLEKYEDFETEEENTQKNTDEDDNNQEEKIDLDFQKEVEDKILKAKEKGTSSQEFQFLKKIYDEIKKFDSDLPNKFLGIESTAEETLKQLGDKYSDEFLTKVKQNKDILTTELKKQIQNFDNLITSQNFQLLIKTFNTIIKNYNLFPKEFLTEKLILSQEIRKREILLNKKLKEFKKEKLKKIISELNSKCLKLTKLLKPGCAQEIDDAISDLHNTLNSTPKIFLTQINDEKIIITKVLIKAEKFLEQEYTREFDFRKTQIENLTNKYHKYFAEKNLNECLITYNQILLEFEKLPEVFIEKKINIYKQINKLYTTLNNLIIKENLSKFLTTYNYSKTIEEVEEYFKHVLSTKKIDIETAKTIEKKINELPNNIGIEKFQMKKKLDYLLKTYPHETSTKKTQQSTLDTDTISKFLNNKDLENKNSQQLNSNKNSLNFQTLNINTNNPTSKKKEEKPLPKNPTKIKLNTNSFNLKNNNINKTILEEIELIFDNMKKTNNKHEFKILYKKIMFYLKITPFNEATKTQIKNNVNIILNSKNFK